MTAPYQHLTLPNGLQIVALTRPQAQTALLSVDLRLGARYEVEADAGLSHFLEHMLFQGCEGYPSPTAVNEAAERMGAALDASTGRESVRFEHQIDPLRVDDSAALLVALLRAPRFEAMETERSIILEEGLDELDEEGRLIDADVWARRALWRGAMARSIIGTQDNIARFTVEDLRRHHQRYVHAANMVVTLVSPLEEAHALALLARRFEGLPSGPVSTLPPAESTGPGPNARLVDDHGSQCECRVVYRTAGGRGDDALALALLRVALDDGLASRLHHRLGLELGLAYDQWASYERLADVGVFELGASLSPAKAPRFIEEARALVRGLIEHPPEGEELARVRFRARWSFLTAMDSAEGLASLYGTPHLYWETPRAPEAVLAEVDALTSEDLAAAAARLLRDEDLGVAVVGPLTASQRRAVERQLS
ncbi:insulinase family protein [Myxococcota bacterium]|nr:insulinase family protein [Myxococcota bacterium]MBU1432718.1 insulinase family protein [Myxococcota bacterium]MBU1899413.1 insulinase family protein [Myxococcota bacterium]